MTTPAPGGVLHAEAADQARHRCLCGLAARTGAELDEHLLAVFTADGTVGRDGRRHAASLWFSKRPKIIG